MTILTLIPIQLTKNISRQKRLKILLENHSSDTHEFVIIEKNNFPLNKSIEDLCKQYQTMYLLFNQEQSIFSAAQLRNYGAEHVDSEFILFFDVDLVPPPNFFMQLPELIKHHQLEQHPTHFLMFPSLYLTEKGNQFFLNLPQHIAFKELQRIYLRDGNNSEFIEHLAVGTSTILLQRNHFLSIGGYQKAFYGHGGEDFELIHRLTSYHPIYQRPTDYYLDYKTKCIADYQGFRRYFSTYALSFFFQGLFTVHLWHRRPLSSSYHRVRSDNERKLKKFMQEYDKKYEITENNLRLFPDWTTYLETLQSHYGWDLKKYPGLFTKDNGKPKDKKLWRKIRKLILQPKQFIKDSWIGKIFHNHIK